MELINMTPHPVDIILDDKTITIQSSGVIRLEERIEHRGSINGIPIVFKSMCGWKDINHPQIGVAFIVSMMVAQAAMREDFLVPDDLVRDENGRIIGCRRLASIV